MSAVGAAAIAAVPAWFGTPLALFAGAAFYPRPALLDLRGLYSSLGEASSRGAEIADECFGWWQVVDLRTLRTVAGGGNWQNGGGMCSAEPMPSQKEGL